MGFENSYLNVLKRLPSIASPIKRMTFKQKVKWTVIILLIYFVMSQLTVFGADTARIQAFGLFELILGAKFGSLMSLGIGPIVTASIILQLMVGSKIIPWDLKTEEGKMLFQGSQKLLGITLSIVEAIVFVLMGAVPASAPELIWIVVGQLALGGILVIYMDEVISKWGFGSGIGLFIVAGVSSGIITRAFNPFATNCIDGARLCLPTIDNAPVGLLPQVFFFIGTEPLQAFLAMLPLIATVVVFLLVVYANAIKVEVPLAFGSVRGFGRRWPLKFFYTSNIPVILIAALLANVQLMGNMLAQRGITFLGTFDANGQATSGLVYFLSAPTNNQALGGVMVFIGLFALVGAILAYFTKKSALKLTILFAILGGIVWFAMVPFLGLGSLGYIAPTDILRMITYAAFMICGSVIFSIFWVTTAGMSSKAVAEQIESTGLQIPGYRRDVRIIERVLDRYIPSLAVLGGAAVGALAAYADFTGALGTGTGILLSTMIIFQLYEEIAQQQMEDVHPAIRKLLGKG
ncbi:MAG: preprotein translocase subunit SecY [Candidatus Aenigmatarchaeota archaeon]